MSRRPAHLLLSAAGWVLTLAATFAIDHLELMGLRQAGWVAARDARGASGPSVGGLYVGGLYAFLPRPTPRITPCPNVH